MYHLPLPLETRKMKKACSLMIKDHNLVSLLL